MPEACRVRRTIANHHRRVSCDDLNLSVRPLLRCFVSLVANASPVIVAATDAKGTRRSGAPPETATPQDRTVWG